MMKVFNTKLVYALALLIFITGCKERFEPVLATTSARLLVVEGMINVGGEPTVIKLSRTMPALATGKVIANEQGAQIYIESSDGQSYQLVENQPGTYQSGNLNLDSQKKYRLKIIAKGQQYITDFLEAKISPPIEDITWEAKANGVQIYVNTHDNTNNSRYYRWDFEDTWIFYANYKSLLVWDGAALRPRNLNTEDIYKCWTSANATSIVVGASIKLTNDIIYRQPLVFIPSSSEKFTEKYSILVKQYVLTKEAFEFWDSLRKNTESMGSIFDAQPSQLTGNIKNINNPDETVLGYISAGSAQYKRIFINRDEIPSGIIQHSQKCNPQDTIDLNNIQVFSNPNYLPIGEVTNDAGLLLGYRGAVRECADCTVHGTKKKPDFWP